MQKENLMKTANTIIKAIEKLPEEEYKKLLQWIADHNWEKWDQSIQKDADSGKLDFLIQEGQE